MRSTRLALLGLACEFAACTRPALAPSGINVVSDRSDYSPTSQLAVAIGLLNAIGYTVDVVVDSGSLSVPGEAAEGVDGMNDVYVGALVVMRATAPKGTVLPSPWLALAESDSQLVLSSIARGERRALASMRFRAVRPTTIAVRDAWVVFRTTGIVIPRAAQTAGRRLGNTMADARRFRVYACADWNLTGRVDRKRAQVIRTSSLTAR